MKRLLLALLLLAGPAIAGPGDILVKFRDKRVAPDLVYFGQAVSSIPQLGVEIWHADDPLALLEELNRHPAIEYAVQDIQAQPCLVPSDPRFVEQWALNNTGGAGGVVDADVDAPEAWNTTRGSANVVINVNDSGIDLTHPDLIDALWVNPGEIPGNGIDDEGNGYIDDIHGWDFTYNTPALADSYGHGTHVAGIVGAQHNTVGVAGIAPGCKLMITRGFNASGYGTVSGLVAGMIYAADNGAQISSNSWTFYTGPAEYPIMRDAIIYCQDRGMLICFAAANNGYDLDCMIDSACPGLALPHPGHYPYPALFMVAATTNNDTRAYFSNFGRTIVDIGAPGANILSTYPQILTGGGYRSLSGTSMACPLAAGAAGLVLSNNPTLTYDQLKFVLMSAVDHTAAMNGAVVSNGRLNIGNVWATPTSVEPPGEEVIVRTTSPEGQFDIQGRRTEKELRNQLNFSKKFKRGKKVVIK